MKEPQKLATRVFMTASIVFGVTGIIAILSAPEKGDPPSWLMKILGTLVFIILSSFAISVGYKYLSDK